MITKLQEMLGYLQEDPAILAVLLHGSSASGLADDQSDVDLYVLYTGVSKPEITFPAAPWRWDAAFESIEQFKEVRKTHWSRHAFLTAKIIFDKTGEMQALIDDMIHIPEDARQDIVADYLDAYLNSFYRSMKAMRKKNRLGAILQANLSLKYLIACLYAVNGLIQPYEDCLEATVDLLKAVPLPAVELFEDFYVIANSADASMQSELFRSVEAFFRTRGFGATYDAWGDMLVRECV